jgi:hypothetical protein
LSLEYASNELQNNIYLIYQSIQTSKDVMKYERYGKYNPIIPNKYLIKYGSIEKIYSVFEIYTTKEKKLYHNDFDLLIINNN